MRGCSILVVLSLIACGEGKAERDGSADGGAEVAPSPDVAAGDVEAGEPVEDGDAPPGARGGSRTLVVDQLEVVSERSCDFDADGVEDNSIADLGSPWSTMLAQALSTALTGELGGSNRAVVHLPWLDDAVGMNDAETVVVMTPAAAPDDPPDGGDDLSGEGRYCAKSDGLDPCGEPLFFFDPVSLDRGEIDAPRGTISVGSTLLLEGARAWGSLDSGAPTVELWVCGYGRVGVVGEIERGDLSPDHTPLETFAAGGAVFGLPGVPGIGPAVDLDGDGLERLILDDEGHLESCVDGDGTVIAGRDCWSDERIADAFAFTFMLHAVPAGFLGRCEGWDRNAEEGCAEPPAGSRWSQCAADGDCPDGASCREMPEPQNAGILLCAEP